MKIVDVICSSGLSGFFFDDQRAIKKGAVRDGFCYVSDPVTEGFSKIRQAGECVSIILVLEDGQIASGDCVAVQYSGAGGRDPLFLADDFIPVITNEIAPRLIGKSVNRFRELAEEMDNLVINGKRLHTAIRYGITQGILDAVSKAKKLTMAEVIRDEYSIGIEIKKVPIFTQSGEDRYINVDKMIIKEADVLPHGLINSIEDKVGQNGELLKKYVRWLRNRIMLLRSKETYNPVLHIDVYGTLGIIFNNDVEKIAGYLSDLENEAFPFQLRIEGPVDMEDKMEQIRILRKLRRLMKNQGVGVEIVADEWCNTLDDIKLFADKGAADMIQIKTPDLGGVNNIVEAILYCKKKNVGAYCGGSCNETEKSACVCANIAMACGADQCLAKPGMGVDEGFMIVLNEMNRVAALVKARNRINTRLGILKGNE